MSNVLAPPDFLGFEHVQLIIPDGKERRAREFYVDVLGFTEIVRPESLGGRGGGWFRNGAVHLHLGAEHDFHPTGKGHPAWLVPDLSALVERCQSAGHPIEIAVPLPGFERVHVYDPFGNRLELMERRFAG
jgi:catechol 2,3-dioxygenase-like lactoylglutathione lyase family enzyme